jgi:hypothetical protein
MMIGMETVMVALLGLFAVAVVGRKLMVGIRPAFEPPQGSFSQGEAGSCGGGGCGSCSTKSGQTH